MIHAAENPSKRSRQDGGSGCFHRGGEGVITYKSRDLAFDEMLKRGVNGITSFLTGSDVSSTCSGLPFLARQDGPFGASLGRVLFINRPRYWRLTLSTIHAHARQFSVLRTLNLQGKNIGDEGMAAFAGIFTAHPNALSQLQTLVLGGNEIGDVGVAAFAGIFTAHMRPSTWHSTRRSIQPSTWPSMLPSWRRCPS